MTINVQLRKDGYIYAQESKSNEWRRISVTFFQSLLKSALPSNATDVLIEFEDDEDADNADFYFKCGIHKSPVFDFDFARQDWKGIAGWQQWVTEQLGLYKNWYDNLPEGEQTVTFKVN